MDSQALDHERKANSASGAEALKHAVAAAELYMSSAKKAASPAERAKLSRKCEDMIVLAEKLKSLSVASASDPPGPRSDRQLTTAEKTILLKSSKLHGKVFPPWETNPDTNAFDKKGGEMFIDSTDFTMSPKQKELCTGWKRPVELLAKDSQVDAHKLSEDMMTANNDSDLVQDMVTDCSVVASLSAAMRQLAPQQDSLLSSLIYPFDRTASRPALSANGKYVFRMFFNGCARAVTIDDRLPSSSTSRTLFVVDQRNPRLIWPALMEKAYLKVRGGYDFPGSNSGTDLHVLTGWIPEQLFLHHDDFEPDAAWEAMSRAHAAGDVVATLGTPFLSAEEEAALGLVGEHDYAVMDLRDDDDSQSGRGGRRMLVKNPWRNSVVWRGVGSSFATAVVASSPSVPPGDPVDERNGTFWMPFDDVVRNFDSLYLNWNPRLFAHRQDHHFAWTLPPKTVAGALTHNPQYSVRSPTSDPVWILLSRHWQDGELDRLREMGGSDGGDAAATSLASVSSTLGFMSLLVYASGTRMALPERAPLHRSAYVDSPNTLVRLEVPTAGKAYTVVVAQIDLPLPRYSFTLSFLSSAPLTVAPAPEPLPYRSEVEGAWTRRSAGGNAASPGYDRNPQFAVVVPPGAGARSLELLLTADVPDLPVHVALMYPASSGTAAGRVIGSPATRRDVLAASPEYRRGAAVATAAAPVPPGTYVAVVSTFEPGQLAHFVLRLASDVAIAVQAVAPDAAGRLRTEAWPLPRAGGSAAGGSRVCRALVTVSRLTRVSAVARCGVGRAGGASAIRVSLELGTGPHNSVLGVTGEGEFVDCSSSSSMLGGGLRTQEVDIDPARARAARGLWLVAEQIGGGSGGGDAGDGIQIELLTDTAVQIGPWEAVEI